LDKRTKNITKPVATVESTPNNKKIPQFIPSIIGDSTAPKQTGHAKTVGAVSAHSATVASIVRKPNRPTITVSRPSLVKTDSASPAGKQHCVPRKEPGNK
jgi:hypothetical protein